MQDFWKVVFSFWSPWEEDGVRRGAWGSEQGVEAREISEEGILDEGEEEEDLGDLGSATDSEMDFWIFE